MQLSISQQLLTYNMLLHYIKLFSHYILQADRFFEPSEAFANFITAFGGEINLGFFDGVGELLASSGGDFN
jgi:hypothetical protein